MTPQEAWIALGKTSVLDRYRHCVVVGEAEYDAMTQAMLTPAPAPSRAKYEAMKAALTECEMIMRGARATLLRLSPNVNVKFEVHDAVAAQAVAALKMPDDTPSPGVSVAAKIRELVREGLGINTHQAMHNALDRTLALLNAEPGMVQKEAGEFAGVRVYGDSNRGCGHVYGRSPKGEYWEQNTMQESRWDESDMEWAGWGNHLLPPAEATAWIKAHPLPAAKTGLQQEAVDSADAAVKPYDERAGRIYYQDIVYHVCNCLDRINGGKGRVVCGTYQSPSQEVQTQMSAIAVQAAKTGPDAPRGNAGVEARESQSNRVIPESAPASTEPKPLTVADLKEGGTFEYSYGLIGSNNWLNCIVHRGRAVIGFGTNKKFKMNLGDVRLVQRNVRNLRQPVAAQEPPKTDQIEFLQRAAANLSAENERLRKELAEAKGQLAKIVPLARRAAKMMQAWPFLLEEQWIVEFREEETDSVSAIFGRLEQKISAALPPETK